MSNGMTGRDAEHVLEALAGMEPRGQAEMLAEVMAEMIEDGAPALEVRHAVARLCRRLRLDPAALRRSLH